jgi:hypothetical protein
VLTAMIAAAFALAFVFGPEVIGFNLFFVPFLTFELWNVRRMRPRTRIPDYRPSDPVEIELDEN